MKSIPLAWQNLAGLYGFELRPAVPPTNATDDGSQHYEIDIYDSVTGARVNRFCTQEFTRLFEDLESAQQHFEWLRHNDEPI